MKGQLAFESITNMRDDLILEAAEKLSLSFPATHRRREKDGGLSRFLNSGWGVAMICALVSLSVLAAIIWAGNRPPTIKPPVGTNEPESESATPHIHEFGEWVTTKEATCTQNGNRKRTCPCGEVEEETLLERKPHAETAMPDQEPTVTENGSRGGTVCAVCGTVLTEPHTIIPYIGHTDLAYEPLPDGQNCAITGRGSCTASELYVPSEINGYTVTMIAEGAFEGDETLTKVQLPHTLNILDTDAFIRCSALSQVNFPDSLAYIGPFAFGGCSSLTRVELPDEILILNSGAFVHCSSLTEIIFPDKLQILYPFALAYCTALTEVYLPASLKQIDTDAFTQCTALTDIYFAGTKAQWKAIGYTSADRVTVHFKIIPEAEAMKIASDYWHIQTGDTDPDNGFQYRIESQGILQTPEGRDAYNIFLRWLVRTSEGSHYSTVENIWVDAVTGEVTYP